MASQFASFLRPPRRRAFPARDTRGMTLIEMLAVLAIVGMLTGMGLPKLQSTIEQARIARAIGDIEAIQMELMSQDTLPDNLGAIQRAGMLDPWGNPYVYNKFPPNRHVPPGARRDRFLVPINSTFDLYSMGKDGRSSYPLQAAPSRDDIVRGNDGAFIGLASKF